MPHAFNDEGVSPLVIYLISQISKLLLFLIPLQNFHYLMKHLCFAGLGFGSASWKKTLQHGLPISFRKLSAKEINETLPGQQQHIWKQSTQNRCDYTTLNKLRPRKATPLNKHRPKGVALPYTWATKKQAATQISANIDLQNPAMLAIMIQNMEKWRHDSLIEMHLHTCTLQRNSCEDHKRRPDHLIHTWCLGAFGIVQGFTANFN